MRISTAAPANPKTTRLANHVTDPLSTDPVSTDLVSIAFTKTKSISTNRRSIALRTGANR
jgi:hypothetical protein